MTSGMSPREFQDYLGLLSRLLRLRASQRTAIEEELRAHMEERFAALTSQGIKPARAVSLALAEFGDAAALAAEFAAISRVQKRRWMMRFTVGSMAAGVVLLALVTAMWPDGSGELTNQVAHAQEMKEPPPAKAAEQDANARTEAKLEKLGSAVFIDTPLQDVMEYLADFAGVQVYIDRRSLEDVGIDAGQSMVTMNLKDVPMEMVLRMVLRQSDLAYMLDHGVVIVTTPEQVRTNLEIRVYSIRELIQPPNKPAAAESPAGPSSRYDHVAVGAGLNASGHVTALIELINSTVDPESWDSVGGAATIQQYRGALVIAQTAEAHRKVEKLLLELQEAIVPGFPASPLRGPAISRPPNPSGGMGGGMGIPEGARGGMGTGRR